MLLRLWRTKLSLPMVSRLRWLALGWVIMFICVALGGGYILKSNSIILAKPAVAAFAGLPGGIRLHGALLLTLGLVLGAGLLQPVFGHPEPRRYLQIALFFTAGYWFWTATLYALAPAVKGGEFSYTSLIVWLALTALPVILSLAPPPELIVRDETTLIRTAMRVGCSPVQASALANAYFHGGADDDPQ